jgi:hypothetical protein
MPDYQYNPQPLGCTIRSGSSTRFGGAAPGGNGVSDLDEWPCSSEVVKLEAFVKSFSLSPNPSDAHAGAGSARGDASRLSPRLAETTVTGATTGTGGLVSCRGGNGGGMVADSGIAATCDCAIEGGCVGCIGYRYVIPLPEEADAIVLGEPSTSE